MLKREHWLGLARELDWDLSYAQAREVFPAAVSGYWASLGLTLAHDDDDAPGPGQDAP